MNPENLSQASNPFLGYDLVLGGPRILRKVSGRCKARIPARAPVVPAPEPDHTAMIQASVPPPAAMVPAPVPAPAEWFRPQFRPQQPWGLEKSGKLKQRWVGQVFSSPGSRGVSILISKKISFELTDLLVNIYAPNSAQASFMCPLLTSLAQYTDSSILMGGDFNLVKDASLDRSGHPLPMDRSLSSAFIELLESLAMADVWRTLYPLSREYTFYSKVHKSYSRIDYLLISHSVIKNVINADIHSIVLSDHAPQSITFFLYASENIPKQWRFNNTLLKDDTFISLIENKSKEYISINVDSVSSIQNVWEAFKATFRGVVKSVQRRKGITGISLPSCALWKNPLFTARGIKIGCHEHLAMNLKRLANKKGMISGIYKLLLTSTANTNLQTQKRWEQDITLTLTPVEWDRIWSNSTSISKCVRFRVIQLQILHRAYITPCRLKKMDQTLLGLCWHAWLCGSGYPFTLSLVLSGCKISLGRSWRYTR
ncbi:hypothetical protein F7725_002242 [Dissostichus mawsoni]|uniref:exodeoxyribonuclease III n=1 Tax=Dissostichus mawsoni TaxID=36200 RepID=A0A7J5Y2W9_DISMA|nr:hypothetical protein F7725_002242 [Dissostichus mawsoni]